MAARTTIVGGDWFVEMLVNGPQLLEAFMKWNIFPREKQWLCLASSLHIFKRFEEKLLEYALHIGKNC